MKTKPPLIILLLFCLLLFLSAYPVWAFEKQTSTLADQTALELTVYNSNLGLVKDQRELPLPRGQQELKFMDVAAQIIPTSVRIGTLKNPQQLQVLEQNYEYDLLNPRKLLDKYVGREVKLYSRNYYTDKENNLGMPLPKGTLRVYKQDSEKSLQLVGEDTVDHTPKDEKIRVKMGEAFDLTASRKQMNWEKIASDSYEASYEISLRNHKTEDVVIKVVEPLPGDWKVLEHSHPFTKMDSGTLSFDVPVAKEQSAQLKYRVRLRF